MFPEMFDNGDCFGHVLQTGTSDGFTGGSSGSSGFFSHVLQTSFSPTFGRAGPSRFAPQNAKTIVPKSLVSVSKAMASSFYRAARSMTDLRVRVKKIADISGTMRTEILLGALPDSIVDLAALVSLECDFCQNLTELPSAFGNLTALTNLDINHCTNIVGLPDSISALTRLRSLNMSRCRSVTALPSVAMGKLSSLEDLCLYDCNYLMALPESLSALTSLSSLDIVGCDGLSMSKEQLDSLSRLLRLKMMGVGA